MSAKPPQAGNIPQKEALSALNILSAIHRLTIKTFEASNRPNLIFLMLNDTVSVTRYDRAVLWDIDRPVPKLLGVSGQSSINAMSEIARKWRRMVNEIKELKAIQIITPDHFTKERELWTQYEASSFKPSILWVPIPVEGRPTLGLWLERWEKSTWTPQEAEILTSVAQAYGVAWGKLSPRISHHFKRYFFYILLASVLFGSAFIRVPLRIVAPCEVIPKDPILITAPLEEIIERVSVEPGQAVEKGDVLAEYDKRVALQTLRIAQEEMRIAEKDLTRARTLAFKDNKALAEIAVLEAKVKREQANLALAKYRASRLLVKSPEKGVVMLENPDEWRSKPVKVGEKIMMIINPKSTRVRFWIPENDNIPLDLDRPIQVFLNVTPTLDRKARINFISNASIVTEKNVVSFLAEADWIEEQPDVKPGLKGTALLYGEKVSLFYWIMRKPWATLRHYVGF